MCLVLHSGKEKGLVLCLVLHSGKEKGLVLCVWCYIVAKRKGWFYVFGVT